MIKPGLAVAIALAAVAVSGCGDEGENSASADAVTTAPARTVTAAPEPEPVVTTTPEPSRPRSDCRHFGSLGGSIYELLIKARSGQWVGDLYPLTREFNDLATRVPEGLEYDFDLLHDTFRTIRKTVSGIDYPAGERPSRAALAALPDPDDLYLRESIENVEEWATTDCREALPPPEIVRP